MPVTFDGAGLVQNFKLLKMIVNSLECHNYLWDSCV